VLETRDVGVSGISRRPAAHAGGGSSVWACGGYTGLPVQPSSKVRERNP